MSEPIACELEYTTLENDDGRYIESVELTCSECGHKTTSFGVGDRSVKRCLALMREECPEGQRNFYEAEKC